MPSATAAVTEADPAATRVVAASAGRSRPAADPRRRPRRRGTGTEIVTLSSSTIDDGLRVVTERMVDARSVTMGFWVGTGSVDETGALWGASHFLEHLLFKGTTTRSARSIAEAVDASGGDMNAFTTREYTAFYVRLLAEQADIGLDILSDILWSPAFRPDEFESERQVILEEILMHNDEPADLVHDVLAGALWPDHPLGREVLGEEDTISAMTRGQVADFHGEHYRPGNMVFAAAGALDHDRVAASLTERLRGVTGGVTPARRPPVIGSGGPVVVSRATEQAHVAVGVPAIDRHDDRRYVLSILDHVLGGGMSSRLFQEVREERGLAYSVYSYKASYEGAGALAVYAGTSPAHVRQVLDLIHAELDAMAAKGITEAELASARSHVRGSLVLGLEDSGARMSRIGHGQISHGRVAPLEEVEERYAAVTVEDVAALAAEVLEGPRSVAVIGPFDDDEIARR
jgi:predicted Zn-dependent peptidase